METHLPTRRQTLVGVGWLVLAAALVPDSAAYDGAPLSSRGEADRALTLRLADSFRRQTWSYLGRTWDERRDTIALHRHEVVRITLVNDTQDAVELPATGPFAGTKLAAGETRSILLQVSDATPFELTAISYGEGLTKACSRRLRRFEVESRTLPRTGRLSVRPTPARTP
jgi:hypothetical protein